MHSELESRWTKSAWMVRQERTRHHSPARILSASAAAVRSITLSPS